QDAAGDRIPDLGGRVGRGADAVLARQSEMADCPGSSGRFGHRRARYRAVRGHARTPVGGTPVGGVQAEAGGTVVAAERTNERQRDEAEERFTATNAHRGSSPWIRASRPRKPVRPASEQATCLRG